jgi:hypothetical protein
LAVYTNCVELIEQRAPQPENRGSALGNEAPREESEKIDLQKGARKKPNIMQQVIEMQRRREQAKRQKEIQQERGIER